MCSVSETKINQLAGHNLGMLTALIKYLTALLEYNILYSVDL